MYDGGNPQKGLSGDEGWRFKKTHPSDGRSLRKHTQESQPSIRGGVDFDQKVKSP